MPADPTRAERRRAYRGPAVLHQGFRPFFLAAGAWAVLAMGLWFGMLSGDLDLPSAFDPLTWHSHEMLFGFAVAAIAGFLLTAVPNWTGRLPVQGTRLGGLSLVWVAGRIAVACSSIIGPVVAALIDLAFLVALCGILLREILAGRNWRNLAVAGVVGLLAICNLLVHLEVIGIAETAAVGLRLTVAVILVLIALIGGRIVPSFTRNWLNKLNENRLPSPFALTDRIALALTILAGLVWALKPEGMASGLLALLAAGANGVRLARWRGLRTLSEPLVWVLHLGYAWLVAGFGLLGVSLIFVQLPQSTALHALTAGAMGTMILAVMTRATLGHTGQALRAGLGTAAIYGLVTAAALLRILSQVLESGSAALLALSAVCWIGAFGLFLALYAPLLVTARTTD